MSGQKRPDLTTPQFLKGEANGSAQLEDRPRQLSGVLLLWPTPSWHNRTSGLLAATELIVVRRLPSTAARPGRG